MRAWAVVETGKPLKELELPTPEPTGKQVLPLCPFIKAWIGKHPDYHDLVYGQPQTTAKD